MKRVTHTMRTLLAAGRHSQTEQSELKAFQDSELRRLLVHAYEQVPYYRRLFERHRLHPRHIRGTIDLDLLPITSKQDLHAQPASKLIAQGLSPEGLVTVRTSGSSGEPLLIRRTWGEQTVQHVLRLRAYRSLGVRPLDRTATVGLVRPRDPRDPKLVCRIRQGIGRSLHIDGLEEPEVIERSLSEYRPDVMVGLSGMLCRVADYVLSTKERRIEPRLLIVEGEVLTPLIRRRLREAFNAPVYECYGSHEFPLLAWECTSTGELHTCDDGVILEVLRDGRPAEPGERGEVVATNLHAYAMPFIRYRLGDVVTRGKERCRCGRPFATIRAIQGRMIDHFPLPGGRMLHPYQITSSFMTGADTWIRQYQLLQERRDRIVLRVLPLHTPAPEHVAGIERSVLPLLGPGVEFEVQLVDALPLDVTGKFRHSRSLIQSEHGEVSDQLAHG